MNDQLEIFQNPQLLTFAKGNLEESLSSIGFSNELIKSLLTTLDVLDVNIFGEKHAGELENVYRIGFFQKIVPEYFRENIIPEIPMSGKVLDIGCGTGILAKLLSEVYQSLNVVGVDINEYPEWKSFSSERVKFEVVEESEFPEFLSEYKPDVVVLTWTLHHMEKPEQEQYLNILYKTMRKDSLLVVLEDSFSERMEPEQGLDRYEKFKKLSNTERTQVMSLYDWIANKVLAQRVKVPMPYSYRNLEEWLDISEQIGFTVLKAKFIGFPEHRDINTPQSLFVLKKP